MQVHPGSSNDLWVFREGRVSVHGRTLLRELENAAQSLLSRHPTTRAIINALLRAGEFESALADSVPEHASAAGSVTEVLATCLSDKDAEALRQIPAALRNLQSVPIPEVLSISPPEGFAYYALHPLDFAKLAEEAVQGCQATAIVGIRTIGTTLGAIVLAVAQLRGGPAARITVRPTGHPYDRVTHFTSQQLRWIHSRRATGAKFLIVDEGPGRSGSSFLSVAEALEAAGVPVERILMMGTRYIDPDDLCAANAPSRWRRFRFVWPRSTMYVRFDREIYIGGGEWRKELQNSPEWAWPSCWPQMERFKFLSADRKWIYKFDGFGRFGEDVLQRARIMADAGFGPPAEHAGDGMIQYPLVPGKRLDYKDVSTTMLERMAQYCAFRAANFRVANPAPSQVPDMLRFNIEQEFGMDVDLDLSPLTPGDAVLADGRMQPHEWTAATAGPLIKFDGCTHGDDHFFPGPTDIAWDLAGAIAEWRLDNGASDFLLSRFHRLTGGFVARRLRPFLLAYTVFRLSYCRMALSSVVGTADFSRLQRAAEYYREVAARQLQPNTTQEDRLPRRRILRAAFISEAGPAA